MMTTSGPATRATFSTVENASLALVSESHILETVAESLVLAEIRNIKPRI